MALPFGAHARLSSSQNPSPLAFGFGLGIPQHHLPPPPTPTLQSQYDTQIMGHHSASSQTGTPARASTKRRLEPENQDGDASMDTHRSPSPDRPKHQLRAKRMRVSPSDAQKANNTGPDGKTLPEEDDAVDLGSLLASLPSSSLLPILTSLITERPELKPVVLSLLPRPTLETAVQAISDAIRKLREAYPYSLQANHATSTTFGFGQVATQGTTGPMRESYIRTRLRQPARDFTKLALSYFAYFTSSPSTSAGTLASPSKQPVVHLHPSETFTFLHSLTLQLLRLPPLTLSEFARPTENLLFPRLQSEWAFWLQRIDDDVNKWGGMYRDEVVRSWERGLEELVTAEEILMQQNQGSVPVQGYLGARVLRDRWVERVGWLIGRRSNAPGISLGSEHQMV